MLASPRVVEEVDSTAQLMQRLMQSSAQPRCMEIELGGGLYGLNVDDVKEVVALRPISKVFHAPSVIAGVANLRGDVLAVIDLCALLTGTPSRRAAASRIVVLRDRTGTRRQAGLLVDRLGVLRDMPQELALVPATLGPLHSRLIAGVLSSPPPCSVIDVAQLFALPQLSLFATGEEGS